MGVIALLIVLGLLFRVVGKVKTARFFSFTAMLLLLIFSSPQISSLLIGYLEEQHPPVAIDKLPDADIVIMLGGVLNLPVQPRLYTELVDASDRLLHTSRIFKQGKVERIFLAGGNVFEGAVAQGESFFSKQVLQEWGVPGNRIDIDGASKTTFENAINARDYIYRNGFVKKPILLVTSALHMPRAMATFKKLDLNVIPVTTDIHVTQSSAPGFYSWIPSAGALNGVTVAWHEIAGLWYYRFRGWAL